MIGFDSSEWTRSGDAGSAGVTELIAHSGIKICRSLGSLPASIGRAGTLILAGNVALVLYFKGLDRASHVEFGHGLHGVAHAYVGDFHSRLVLRRMTAFQRHQVSNIQLVTNVFMQIQRLELRMPEM